MPANYLPPWRRCPSCGRSFRAWQDANACPPCRRERKPDREALTDELAARRVVDESARVPEPVPYNEFPPGY